MRCAHALRISPEYWAGRMTRPEPMDEDEETKAAQRRKDAVVGLGWRLGCDTDLPKGQPKLTLPPCPFEDPRQREMWRDGFLGGSYARGWLEGYSCRNANQPIAYPWDDSEGAKSFNDGLLDGYDKQQEKKRLPARFGSQIKLEEAVRMFKAYKGNGGTMTYCQLEEEFNIKWGNGKHAWNVLRRHAQALRERFPISGRLIFDDVANAMSMAQAAPETNLPEPTREDLEEEENLARNADGMITRAAEEFAKLGAKTPNQDD